MATAQQLDSELERIPPQSVGLVPVAPTPIAAQTPLEIVHMAVMQNMDADRLLKVLDFAERLQANRAHMAFVSAMNAFKANPPAVLKNKKITAGQATYNYATLDSVCRAVTKHLSKHGLSHRWKMEQADGWIKVTCILTHDLGHSEETTLQGAPDQTGSKNAVQAIASTVTYLERYTLLAACGLAAEGTDNDGRGPSNGVPVERFRANCDAMFKAKDLAELKRLWETAYREANEAKDRNAMQGYIQAKETRKKELGGRP